jgi:cytochrome-b5 reductase
MVDDNILLAGIVSAVALILGFLFLMNKKKTVLPLDDFKPFPLIRKTVLSHDTAEFVFGLPTPDSVLGLPTGQHISLRFFETDENGKKKQVMRSYTPVSDNTTLGEVAVVIKIYRAGVHPKFPEGGKLSQHLDSLKIGDTIDIKGPKGHMEYLGNGGNYWMKPIGRPKVTKQCKQFIMIAGGTGITPMLQVAHYMFRNNDDVKVHLLYANQTEDDILCRKELEQMAKDHSNKFKIHYTVDRPPADGSWKGSTGFITKEMIEANCLFNGSSKKTQVFMCGPPPMLKFACLPNLKELGFTKDDWFAF